MRILLVSHSYADPGYWDKLDALGRRVELAVVMPARWRGYLHPAAPTPACEAGATWRQHGLATLAAGRSFRYVYRPQQLARVLAGFRPDLVYVRRSRRA